MSSGSRSSSAVTRRAAGLGSACTSRGRSPSRTTAACARWPVALLASNCGCRGPLPDRQRQLGAGLTCTLGMLHELVGKGAAVDDRVAPVVEVDPLREELGADAVAGARDRVHLQVLAHPAALSASPSPNLNVVGRRHEWQGPPRW